MSFGIYQAPFEIGLITRNIPRTREH